MSHRSMLRWSLTVAALFGAQIAGAAPITLTGNVATDFSSSIPGVSDVLANDYQVQIPDHIAEQPWQVAAGLNSGWNIKDMRMYYDAKSDTMYVGVSTYGQYAGDIVGNGGKPNPNVVYGADPANFGLDKSITVGFSQYAASDTTNPSNPPSPVIVAGVPGPKSGPNSEAGPGLDGFNVAKYSGSSVAGSSGQTQNILDLPGGYGQTLTAGMGSLAYNPDPAHPGFEFTITNFSKISGLNPANGLWVEVYAGSEQTQIAGKDFQQGAYGAAAQVQTVPEPATCVLWAIGAGAAFLRLRQRGKN